MTHANCVEVTLLNNLTSSEVLSANYMIYGLDFQEEGFYVGFTKDFVTSYYENYHSAWRVHNDRGRNKRLKKASRNFPKKSFIIAIANSSQKAEAIKAAAIAYYDCSLNSNRYHYITKSEIELKPREFEYGKCTLYSRRDTRDQHRNKITDRKFHICKIVWERSKKRVKCIDEEFKGLYVQCSQKERDKYSVGDLVKVKAAIAKAKNQLIAPKTAKLLPADAQVFG